MARESKKETSSSRKMLRRIAVVVAGAAIISAAAVYLLHRYAVSDRQFVFSRERRDALTIDGLRYASRAKVQRIFADDTDRSVFSVPLEERRRRLLAIDWVEDAAVSRVWPDRLAVRITERKPVAFVLVESTVMLIDSHGMLLEPPARASFAFPVLSGIRAGDSPAARLEAVNTLLRVESELGPLMKDVSEVNVGDRNNLHAIAQVEGRTLELILGDENLGARFQNFLNHYAEVRKRAPDKTVFDLRLDDRILAEGTGF
jgi:cell division protein FtsQ